VEGITEELQSRGDPKLTAVHLRIGEMSGVVREALLFAYEQACSGTPLEGSTLLIAEGSGRELAITAMEIEA